MRVIVPVDVKTILLGIVSLWICSLGICPLAMGGELVAHAAQAEGRSTDNVLRWVIDEHFMTAVAPAPIEGFHAYEGNWRVEDGVLWAGAAAGSKLICDQPGFSQGEVGVEMLFEDNQEGSAGLIVKVGRAGIGADAFDGYEVALDARFQAARLGRHVQNFQLIRDVPCPVPVNEWIPLVVRMTETRIEVVVDGKSVYAFDDTQQPLRSGQVGLRPWQRNVRFRNLWIAPGGDKRNVAFVEPEAKAEQLSPGWLPYKRSDLLGEFAIDPIQLAGAQRHVQRISCTGQSGEVGIAYDRAETRRAVVAGITYQGYAEIDCDEPTEIFATLESAEGQVLAEHKLEAAGTGWQRLPLFLTPALGADDTTMRLTLRRPGTIRVRRLLLQPDDAGWPRSLATKTLPKLAFITRHPLTAPPAVGQDLWAAQPVAPGCSIRIWDPGQPEKPATTIFNDPDGCIYDMNVSADAQTLFFSYRAADESHWHIWRIGIDGGELRRLTDGPYYDVSPCELPDGSLAFVSTRRFGYTVCQPGPASNLFRMDADGGDIRCVSMNTLSDLSPQMLPDGRILFTRWEYIDRDLTYRQSLWTQYPDGSAYQLFFGNTVRHVGTFWQARPLPGSNDRLVATFAPHHGYPHGAIGLIDRSFGLEAGRDIGFTYLTREFPVIEDRRLEWAFRDPFPVSDESFLCSYGGGGVHRYRLYLLDTHDRKRLLYEDAEQGCYFPLALVRTALPHQVPDRTLDLPALGDGVAEAPEPTGTLLLTNVHYGLDAGGDAAKAIAVDGTKPVATYLRVMEQVRKSEDLVGRAYDQSPVMSYGTYYAKRSWGQVPIEKDGSAHFTVPALRELYFQVLDAEGREMQRMTSAVQLMPGEQLSCIGCHEPRGSAPPASSMTPLAALRPPRQLVRPAWLSDGMVDFCKVVQPVLDKYCVRCHQGQNPDGGCDLTGDKTRYFNMAYDNLLGRSRSYRQHNMLTGEMLPDEAARPKPLVHFYWLLRTPSAVNQPFWTGSYASRLLDYIDTDHCEQMIPLADRQRVYLWIDANVPYYSTYAHSRPASPGRRDRWTDAETGQLAPWFAQEFSAVYQRRCVDCHGALEGTTDWEGRYAWINLTRPANSAALTAHLASSAGGRGIVDADRGLTQPLFKSTADPDYQAIWHAIQEGERQMLAHPEADMPGFLGARPEY